MTDLRDRFHSLDRARAPDLWSEVTERASGAAQVRSPWSRATSPTIRIALVLLALLVLTSIGIALVGRVLEPTPLEPTPPWGDASNGWIAVSANPWDISGGESGDIYLLSDGAAPRRIIGSDGDRVAQACPQFSPDGTRLAYGEADAGGPATNNMRRFWLVTDRAVEVVEVDSAGGVSAPIARVTLPPEKGDMPCPEWSPDGQSIAFRDRQTLWVVDAESGETAAFDLTASGEQERAPFAWSRDGSHIAVAQPGEIRVLRVDDGTSSLIDVEGGTPDSVSWTRGDAAIAYVATKGASLGFNEELAVHVVGVDGQNDQQLTPDSPDPQTQLRFYGAVTSPDGTRLAYVGHSYRCTTTGSGDGSEMRCPGSFSLLTIDLDGSNLVELPLADGIFTPGRALEDHFGLQWSPDGERLLLSSIAGVVSVSPASSSSTIVHSSGDELNLEWSASRVAWQPIFAAER